MNPNNAFNDKSPYVRALKLMLDELEHPSRESRIAAQALYCQDELATIHRWLRREIERAIDAETMFDDGREPELPAP